MSELKPTLLRLRQTTVDALKLELKTSSHRSMASLADEILSKELGRRQEAQSEQLDKLVNAARRVT
jgi:hypothetical protein